MLCFGWFDSHKGVLVKQGHQKQDKKESRWKRETVIEIEEPVFGLVSEDSVFIGIFFWF